MSTGASTFAVLSSMLSLCCVSSVLAEEQAWGDQGKQLLWGDTHVHSSYSADAYLSGNFSADPDTAYRFAKGQPVIHPYHRSRVQSSTPLDFLVVADHAEFLGGIRRVHSGNVDTSELSFIDRIIVWLSSKLFAYALADGFGMDFFESQTAQPMDPQTRARQLFEGEALGLPGQKAIVRNAWREVTAAADAHNEPGTFTALIGWEWTSTPGGANLHRIVITDGDAASTSGYLPYSRDDSPYPEDLWRWLEQTSEQSGANFISIPHNSNLSKGFMFPTQTLRGKAFDAQYLQLRAKWEPVVEATQIKGDSETHPRLSPADTFADFERYAFYIQAFPTEYRPQEGDFVRSSLKRGLEIQAREGINPYRFGMIGSTDSHTGIASAQESNFHGKLAPDSIPANKALGIGGDGSASGWDMSASGLAAVWARDNSREEILKALQRREVYATTGPRIAVRVSARWRADTVLPDNSLDDNQIPNTPMGGELPTPAPAGARPEFTLSAMKDPNGANLDRLQVIKGWIDAQGSSQEQVFDVAWSQERSRNNVGQLPAVNNTVRLKDAGYDNSSGAAILQARWRDESFDAAQDAFYYVRVLEIPTPRHSLLDTVALGQEHPAQHPATIQERAYTSPVWYRAQTAP